jgi:TetR/AcrR family transcriptional regulator, cholesterol catabolism regulator
MDAITAAELTSPDATLTAAQIERRQRIVDAAVQLARAGGYDAVQMREVAATADVALGTLYRYFPSKEHLLVSILLDQVQVLAQLVRRHPPDAPDAHGRVVEVLRRATRALQSEPRLTAATLRAFVSPDPSIAVAVRATEQATTDVIVSVLQQPAGASRDSGPPVPPLPAARAVARYLQYIWMASLTSWINGTSRPEQVELDLTEAAALLLAGAAGCREGPV